MSHRSYGSVCWRTSVTVGSTAVPKSRRTIDVEPTSVPEKANRLRSRVRKAKGLPETAGLPKNLPPIALGRLRETFLVGIHLGRSPFMSVQPTCSPSSVHRVSGSRAATFRGSSANPSPAATLTILVADDSKTVRRLNERVLKEAGFQVLLAEDGRQAVDLALEHHPDLVVLDINMPELDGYGVCDELLAHEDWKKDTPFVFLTCAEAPHLNALGNDLGAFLPKPTQADLLLETVVSLLRKLRAKTRR